MESPQPNGAATSSARRRRSLLDWIERIGNRLPHPLTLFVIFAVATVVASGIAALLDVQVPHPRDGSPIAAVNLINAEGARRMFLEAVKNFTGFAPLGMVLVAMLGIGVAEATGLIGVSLRAIVMSVPRSWLTATVAFLAINANQAADAAIIVLPPVAAMLFAAAGRHPLAGIAVAYAGVTGGFSANLLPSTLDVLLAGFTQEAVNASKILPGYKVQILGNWYFLAVATPLLTFFATWITERFVEPRLGPWKAGTAPALEPLTAVERRGLRWAFAALGITVALAAALTVLPGAPLRDSAAATLIERIRPFLDSMVVWVLLVFFVPGLAYGIATRKVRNDHEVARILGDTMATMGAYIALAFVAAQFLSYFAWSNLGAIMAITGANVLKSAGLEGAPVIVGLVLLTAFLNLFLTSASSKWAVMAPIFVPMFVLLGLTPEATQAIFRVGDSCTNIITPIFVYLPFIQSYMARYDPRAGTGTIISMMVPYTIAFLPMWTGLLLLFYWFGWPIGPGVIIHLTP
jgi:aminobenzoyl-glutamate transport protein